jgi:hypothetical protein
MVATRATRAVQVSGPAQAAYDRVDPERLLRNAPTAAVIAGPDSAQTGSSAIEQFEIGGLVEHDEARLPMREVQPSTERLTGGKMIYMRKRQ